MNEIHLYNDINNRWRISIKMYIEKMALMKDTRTKPSTHSMTVTIELPEHIFKMLDQSVSSEDKILIRGDIEKSGQTD